MEDVIFAGTEARKPVGFAYVSITLDNADHALPVEYDEVTVTRRVYRSGESEYQMNGHNCRLKDISELFYDTGIGKEGYSIIGQGQIDKILSGKPEDRRELFDEAAGIVKFKRRKASAQKKLDSERANLVRVNDILSELEKQVGPLEKQSEVAKVYLRKKEELKTLDYRSKKELTGQVRLVRFPGSDLCACCGTHVTHTGEIGAVKILTVENFHEGIRLTMICGKRVMDYLNMVNDQNRQVSMKLSAKIGETAAAVARLQDENFRLKGQVNHMFDELCTVEAKNWEGAGSVLLFHEGLEADQVRRMADAVMQKCNGSCAEFSANGDGSYKYAIGEQNGDLRQFTKEMNAALNGRGGGKPFFVQGSVKASEDEIRHFFKQ